MIRKYCRFRTATMQDARFGEIIGDEVIPRDSFEDAARQNQAEETDRIDLADVALVEPVVPGKIVCVGRNYAEHASELGNKVPTEPLLFLKPPSAIVGPGEPIVIPPQSEQVEHEGEIGIVIGRKASKLSESDNPTDYIFGFTCINDVTARDLQRRDVQFTRAKSFDTFCPVGPLIVSGLHHAELTVETRVNSVTKQFGHASKMVFSIEFLIWYISQIMTLFPGDLIATGTPSGVAKLSPGDSVEVEVSGIGVLRNSVIAG